MSRPSQRTGNKRGQRGKHKIRIGLDIGRVIINGDTADLLRVVEKKRKSKRRESFLTIPAVPGVFRHLLRLTKQYDEQNICLISACGENTESKVRAWLEYHNFFRRTGVLREHVYFCRKFRDKAPIAERLTLTHFVDDHWEVLSPMSSVPNRILFHPDENEVARYGGAPRDVIVVRTWRSLIAAISSTE